MKRGLSKLGLLCLLAVGWPQDSEAANGPEEGSGGRKVKRTVEDELPGWMTHKEEAQIVAVEKLLESGNTLGALDILRHMRADGKDSPTLDLLQGIALRKDGVTSEAERLLLLAQKKLNRDARPSSELCILYADTQRLEEAIAACKRATELDPNSPAAWNNLGFLLLASERPDEALLAAEKAIELDGTQERYRNNLGMAQAALGRSDMAFRTLQSTMSKADAAYMVGLVTERFAGQDPARPWYERALKYDPTHREARDAISGRASPPADVTPEEP